MIYFLTIALAVIVVIFLFQKKPEFFNLISKQEGRLKKGIKYLKKNQVITNEQYRELVGVTSRQAVRDLDILEKQGIVKQIGKTGRNTKYRKK